MEIHETTREAILTHIREEHAAAEKVNRRPYEVCGFVVKRGAHQMVVRAVNAHPLPSGHFETAPESVQEAEETGDVLLCYHSHPYGVAEPSDADKATSEKNHLPVLVVVWPNEEWRIYEPDGWHAQLIGRPFVYGIFDCYSLFRDHYKQKLNLEIPDFDHEELEWWKHGKNLFLEHLEETGFQRVSDLQAHDAILCTMDSPAEVPNHIAVYLGDNMMLHHVQDRLSTEQPYIIGHGYYSRMTYGFYRHPSFMVNEQQEEVAA